MSKKKNTLKDLNDFLKQQAAMLVSPDKLSNTIEPEEVKSEQQPIQQVPAEPHEPEEVVSSSATKTSEEITSQKILESLKALQLKEGTAFNKSLCDLIIQSLDSQHTSPEDKMLINTALYIKGGGNWKEVIREYWKNK